MNFEFTYTNLELHYAQMQKNGYQIMTCKDYVTLKKLGQLTNKTVVNRIDIDFSIKKIIPLLEIYKRLRIKGSFFIRLHAAEYNAFAFENYKIIKQLITEGHELGYHSEIIDQAAIWKEDAKNNLIRDLRVLESIFNTKIEGVASHGGQTGLNNLDFWKNHKPKDFDLLYEAYDTEPAFDLFNNSFYISDSEWTRWKCYKNGNLIENDYRTPTQHLLANHSLIYFLIHSDTYFHTHFYE